MIKTMKKTARKKITAVSEADIPVEGSTTNAVSANVEEVKQVIQPLSIDFNKEDIRIKINEIITHLNK